MTTPGSLVFLDSKDIQSNQSRGGNGIVLDPTPDSRPRTAEDEVVLAAHGLDPQHPTWPETLREQTERIAVALGSKVGAIMGFDWLQDAHTGEFYFLEANTSPGLVAYADRCLGGADNVDLVDAKLAMDKAALDQLASRAD